jgi:phosphoglycolate phosphatase
MNNDAIIFDIDGTLWDACPASTKGWNIGLVKLGIDKKFTSEQIESVAGNPYEKCVDILLPGFKGQYPKLLDTLNDCEIEVIKSDGGKFYNGVIEGLKTLASSYKIFLVSNCQEWYMKLFLKFSDIEPLLAGYDCHGMSGSPKNEMLAKIKSNYSLNNPVYVGDTKGDETAANLAGMEFINVSYGFGSPSKGSVSFDSFAALLDYFGGKNTSPNRD